MDAHLAATPRPLPFTAPPHSTGRSRVPLDSPLISVVVVNYHQWRDTAYLVRQIRADCVWRFPFTGLWYTNTVITYRISE